MDEASALLESNRQSNKLAWIKYKQAYQKVLETIQQHGKPQTKNSSRWLFHYLSPESRRELITGYNCNKLYNIEIEGWKLLDGPTINISKESWVAFNTRYDHNLRYPRQKIHALFIKAKLDIIDLEIHTL